MGYRDASGAAFTGARVAKWWEKLMTSGPTSKDLAVKRYNLALRGVGGMKPVEGAQFILELLPDLSPPKIPKKPPS
jgi:hypothetical protein